MILSGGFGPRRQNSAYSLSRVSFFPGPCRRPKHFHFSTFFRKFPFLPRLTSTRANLPRQRSAKDGPTHVGSSSAARKESSTTPERLFLRSSAARLARPTNAASILTLIRPFIVASYWESPLRASWGSSQPHGHPPSEFNFQKNTPRLRLGARGVLSQSSGGSQRRNASCRPPSTVMTWPVVLLRRRETSRKNASAWSAGVIGLLVSVRSA